MFPIEYVEKFAINSDSCCLCGQSDCATRCREWQVIQIDRHVSSVIGFSWSVTCAPRATTVHYFPVSMSRGLVHTAIDMYIFPVQAPTVNLFSEPLPYTPSNYFHRFSHPLFVRSFSFPWFASFHLCTGFPALSDCLFTSCTRKKFTFVSLFLDSFQRNSTNKLNQLSPPNFEENLEAFCGKKGGESPFSYNALL